MKVTINPEVLAKELNLTSLVVHPRSPLPAGSCVKLEAKGKRLWMEGVSKSACIRHYTEDVTVHEEGEAVVDLQLLQADLSSLREDALVAQIKGNNLEIRSGKSFRKRRLVSVDQFLKAPEPRGAKIKIKGSAYVDSMQAVGFATVADGSRPELMGVRVLPDVFLAGDGQRVARIKYKSGHQFVIPSDAFDMVGAICAGHDEVTVVIGTWIFFTTEKVTLGIASTSENYPDAANVVAETYETKKWKARLIIHKEAMIMTLNAMTKYTDRAKVFGIEYAELIWDGYPKIVADIPDIGLIEDAIPVDKVEGSLSEPILFSPNLLRDDIAMVQGDKFEMRLYSAKDPIVVMDPSRDGWIVVQTVMSKKSSIQILEDTNGGNDSDDNDDF